MMENVAARILMVSHQDATVNFRRLLAGYLLFKILLSWFMLAAMTDYRDVPRIQNPVLNVVMWPVSAHDALLNVFLTSGVLVSLWILWRGPGYVNSILQAWVTLNLFVMTFPIGDGADVMLLTLSILGIPLVSRQYMPVHDAARIGYNVSRLLVQLHIVFTYLTSAIDKLKDPVWLSGEAMERVRHYEGLFNTNFPGWLAGPGTDTIYAWMSIAIEMSLALLVWFRATRITVIVVGMIFHLTIWWMLSMPDFALIMMVGLTIFLRDDDYAVLRKIRR